MNVKLTKIYRKPELEGGLRTDEVIGVCQNLPCKGVRFSMLAEPLEIKAGVRLVETSVVQEVKIKQHNLYSFITESGSHYKVEVLP